MGGPLRRQVQAYATGTYRRGTADPLSYIVDEALGYVHQGFPAVKLKIGFDVAADTALIRACREAIGPGIGLMLDANHGYDVLEAVALGRAVADCDIGWLEEPVVPEDLAGYQEATGSARSRRRRGDVVYALEFQGGAQRPRRRHHST